MLTLEEVNARTCACLRCFGYFRIAGPLNQSLRIRLAVMLDQGKTVAAIQTIREETGCDLRTAKATYQHLTLEPGRCHQCGSPIPIAAYVDCAHCYALNIDIRDACDDA